jgi:hypothetical protein
VSFASEEAVVLDCGFWKGLGTKKGRVQERWEDEGKRFVEMIMLGADEEEVGLWWGDLLEGPSLKIK